MIREQIVEKCASKSLGQKLLQQETLDLARTIKLARSEENAAQDSLLISRGTKENPIQIDRLQDKPRADKEQAKTVYACYRCGRKDGHSANECGAINYRCNACKKMGHLQKVCISTGAKPKDSKPNQNRQRQRFPKKRPHKVRSLKTWLDESSGDDQNEPVL